MPSITRLLCPLTGCDWHHDKPGPDDWETRLVMPTAEWLAACDGDYIEAVTYATAAAEHERIDGILRDHLATHRVEDYLLEIVRLRGELADLRQQMAVAEVDIARGVSS